MTVIKTVGEIWTMCCCS